MEHRTEIDKEGIIQIQERQRPVVRKRSKEPLPYPDITECRADTVDRPFFDYTLSLCLIECGEEEYHRNIIQINWKTKNEPFHYHDFQIETGVETLAKRTSQYPRRFITIILTNTATNKTYKFKQYLRNPAYKDQSHDIRAFLQFFCNVATLSDNPRIQKQKDLIERYLQHEVAPPPDPHE